VNIGNEKPVLPPCSIQINGDDIRGLGLKKRITVMKYAYVRAWLMVTECFKNTREGSTCAASFGQPTNKKISASVGLRPLTL